MLCLHQVAWAQILRVDQAVAWHPVTRCEQSYSYCAATKSGSLGTAGCIVHKHSERQQLSLLGLASLVTEAPSSDRWCVGAEWCVVPQGAGLARL